LETQRSLWNIPDYKQNHLPAPASMYAVLTSYCSRSSEV